MLVSRYGVIKELDHCLTGKKAQIRTAWNNHGTRDARPPNLLTINYCGFHENCEVQSQLKFAFFAAVDHRTFKFTLTS